MHEIPKILYDIKGSQVGLLYVRIVIYGVFIHCCWSGHVIVAFAGLTNETPSVEWTDTVEYHD